MPKKVSQVELDAILQIIADAPDGVTVKEIEDQLENTYSLRTLQRRLSSLTQTNDVLPEGAGRTIRYKAVIEEPKTVYYHALTIPISTHGYEIKQIIQQPTGMRRPVRYNRKFLDAYQPNVSAYLPPALREKLHNIGKIHHSYSDIYGKRILQQLILDLCWNSSRLEGNTYSLLETDRLLSSGEMAEGKSPQEAKMILNHKKAIEFLAENIKETGFSRYTIYNIHKLLSQDLLGNSKNEGRLRSHPVGIGGTVYYPLDIPQMIEECFHQIIETAAAIKDPYEQSFFAMVHLPYLQPFIDVNKRTSRLAANIALISHDLCPLSFVDVPARSYLEGTLGVYELNRIDLLRDIYFWAYDRSSMRYAESRQVIGVCEPNPYRSHYHEMIEDIISRIVREKFNKKQAIDFIKYEAHHKVPTYERLRFIETVETELLCLHEGAIAAYRHLRPHEYHAWLEVWK